MAESSVNNIDGIPFWGHGTEENLLNNVTPTSQEVTEEEAEVIDTPEVEEEVESNETEE